MRRIAETAGVSAMTVSLALRNDSRITQATRGRILEIAESLGYRPDPTLKRLMRHLRGGVRRASIALLVDVPAPASNPELAPLLRGARDRADHLGYDVNLLELCEHSLQSHRRLRRIIESRGIEGMVVLSSGRPLFLGDALDWSQLSAVAATNHLQEPQFHRVVPNDRENTLILCRQLDHKGVRRIGLAITHDHDLRTRGQLSEAIAVRNFRSAQEPVVPLICDQLSPSCLTNWFDQYRPEAIISYGPEELATIKHVLRLDDSLRTCLACVRARPDAPDFAGIDIMPEEIGGVAVEVVAKMIECGERGPAKFTRSITIDGKWLSPGRADRAAAAMRAS